MNRKKTGALITALLLQLMTLTTYAQQNSCDKTLQESLQQAADLLNKPESKALWGIFLNAPIIIIDHMTNKMFFTSIEDGVVRPLKEETWNNQIPLANSIFEHKGTKYVTIVHAALMGVPCEHRINLLSHEIFHLHQEALGLKSEMSHNFHMDEVQGRALLQIEMKLLQQALDADAGSLYDALYIRVYRQQLFPNNNEDMYELNEGLAEYTGDKLSMPDMHEYLKKRLNYNISQGYANAFGYITGTSYAMILDDIFPQWRYDKELGKGLVYLIQKADSRYKIEIETDYLDQLLAKYDYKEILEIEEKELNSFGNIDNFKSLLNAGTPKLIIRNEKINFMYNPNDRVVSLGDAVLLRNVTVMGEWGQITAKSGIVRLNNCSAFYLLPPTNITQDTVQGDDYEIKLNQGWEVLKENETYRIVRQ
ncbi:MAG: hypothetical protein LBH92_06435 [Bacteroidales bacterium]|jgi:hypothetical protein|nr:hypothetical protein [Bacteroidales bacterium]